MSNLHNIPAVLAVAVAGSLIAYGAYRRSAQRMAQKRTAGDLRSELRAEQESLRAAIEALPAQIDLAKRGRIAAARAAGNIGTEGMQQWLCELDLDVSEVELLKSQLSAADTDDRKSLSDMDVEIKLVEILALSLRAGALTEKYCASISVQETDGESLTDDPEALTDDAELLTDDEEALLPEASQYSLNNARSSIVESVV
jgi:cell division protein FtsB